MILRSWKARTTRQRLPGYVEQVRAVVEPYLRSFVGFRGAHFATRELDGGELEILVLTMWASMEALEGFSSGGGITRTCRPRSRRR